MTSPVNNLVRLILVTSLLLGGFVASTHYHAPASSSLTQDATLVAPGCSCHHHHSQPSDANSEAPTSPVDHEQCQLCDLLADFNAETLETIELEFSSMVQAHFVVEPTTVSLKRTYRFQGRAPPTV